MVQKKILHTGDSELHVKYTETPKELNARLEKTVANRIKNSDKESARKFLSKLSMYDENGHLID